MANMFFFVALSKSGWWCETKPINLLKLIHKHRDALYTKLTIRMEAHIFHFTRKKRGKTRLFSNEFRMISYLSTATHITHYTTVQRLLKLSLNKKRWKWISVWFIHSKHIKAPTQIFSDNLRWKIPWNNTEREKKKREERNRVNPSLIT